MQAELELVSAPAWHTFSCLDTLPCRWSEPPLAQFPALFCLLLVEISIGLIPKSHKIHQFKINLVDLTTWATSNYPQGYPYREREQVNRILISLVARSEQKRVEKWSSHQNEVLTTRQMSLSCSYNWHSIQALCWAHLCGGNYVKISVKSVAGQTGNLVW